MRLPLISICVVLGAGLISTAVEAAEPKRVAIVVGNNAGSQSDVILRFAQRDATRVAQVLREIGAVQKSDLYLLLEQDADTVRQAFAEAEKQAAQSDGATIILFYYSGHADESGLHLGPTALPWSEIRKHLDESKASLRIALVDACQSGSLTNAKGFSLAPKLEAPDIESSGTALMVSAESTEAAQESLDLGGSFFTHYLVSALRGAADANKDHRITLAEAHSYTTANTRRATGTWGRTEQKPVYEFKITGHGDIVLTDLREGVARLQFDDALDGRVVVTERSSSHVVAETTKRGGESLELALPTGRYMVHLREPKSVFIAEVALPWGGNVTLSKEDMVRHSYQAVAQKGGIVEINRQRVRLGGGVQSAIVDGMGATPVARVAYGYKAAPFEIGARLVASYKSFPTVDTTVDASIFGAGLFFAYEYPLSVIDVRAWVVFEGQYWRQDVNLQGARSSSVFGGGLGAGVRVPIHWNFFGEASVESLIYLPNLEGRGRKPSATLAGDVAVGILF